ncbi:hypothetical protein AALA36_10080 [Lachnospiraceae bacterium 66-29]
MASVKSLPAPFAVCFSEDSRNCVEPDLSVICDKNKGKEWTWEQTAGYQTGSRTVLCL